MPLFFRDRDFKDFFSVINVFIPNFLSSFDEINYFFLSLDNLLTVVFKSHVWSILHALLEMFIHRIHHSPPQYRIQLLSTIHHMAAVPLNTMTQMTQIHLW